MQKCLILFSILIALLFFAAMTGNGEAVEEPGMVIIDNDSIDDIISEDVNAMDKIIANK